MTSKAQITKVASRDGVDARVVERDYVLAHIVALISSHDAESRLVFKGGNKVELDDEDRAALDEAIEAASKGQLIPLDAVRVWLRKL